MANLRLLQLFVAAIALWSAPAFAREPEDDGWFDAGSEGELAREDSPGAQTTPWAEDADPLALTEFQRVLDPYGEWYQHPEFGLLWVPSPAAVGNDFVPYLSAGRWALDTHGNWVWQSDYAFGWVVFHYGRWVQVPGIGWGWVPGYLYSPAWVVWGSPNANIAYVGWAPLGPSFVWIDGVAVAAVGIWSPYWVFCRSRYAFSPWLSLHVVKDEQRREYLRRRTVRRDARQVTPQPTHKWYTPIARGGARGAALPGPRGPEVTGERRRGAEAKPRGVRAPPLDRNASSARLSSPRPERGVSSPTAESSPTTQKQPSGSEPVAQRVVRDGKLRPEREAGATSRPARHARPSSPVRRLAPSPARPAKARVRPAKIRPARSGARLPAARPKRGE